MSIDVKRMRALSVSGLVWLLMTAPCSQTTPLSGTILTSPGSTVFPGLIPAGTPAGTLLASLVSPYSFATTAGITSGTITSAVYRNSSGTLDFYYQVANSASSSTAIAREANTNFTGFTTWTGFRTDAVGPFVVGTVPPVTADSNAAGSVIGFSFNPPNTAKILAGLTSDILVISTNATNFTAGNAAVIDGGTQTVAAFQPLATALTISKAFNPSLIQVGGGSTLTFTITNNNAAAVTGLAFTDTFPAGVVVATPNGLTNTCGGTVTATAGTGSVSLSGGTVNGPSGTTCTISANVIGTTAGGKNNTTSTLTSTNAPTGQPATATLGVASPPTISKAFGASIIQAGNSTTLTFTLTNPAGNGTTFTGLNFSDNLPAGLVVGTPNGLTGSCGGGPITATAGTSVISLSGATLAAGASCTFGVNVTGIAAGVQNNTTGPLSDDQGVPGTAANATTTVVAPPTITKVFTDSELQLFGASTALSFAITNPNTTALTGIAFTDTLPAGLVVSTPNGLTGSCGGGTITATGGSNSISLSGATLAGGASCTFSVNVTGTAVGTFTNTTGPVTAVGGTIVGNAATATISVDFLFFYWFFAA
jgi:uncharacterized repeat protein (TIGR01451 family)